MRSRYAPTPSSWGSEAGPPGTGDTAQMLLREAQAADALAVAELHVRSWQHAYRGLLPGEYLDGLRPEDRARRYTLGTLEPGGPVTVLAVERTAICGFATTAPARDEDRREGGELLALHVDPDRWGRGVGRVLMEDARARLAGAGFQEACLWVLASNERARRFYRTDGWEPDGARRLDGIGGHPVEEVRYCRSLP